MGKYIDLGNGDFIHADSATTQADWDALDPNSLETNCKDCGEYFTVHWSEDEKPPSKLACPNCGSTNHGCVASPAGATHLALWDPNAP